MKLLCVNPSKVIQQRTEKANSTVFFSATLLPIRYYKKMFSTRAEDYAVYAQSSFSENQRLLLIGNDVSSKYTRRGEGEYQRYAGYIAAVAKARTGNYMVFFPSYLFMEEVSRIFDENYGEFGIVKKQGRGMTEQEKEAYLESFEHPVEGKSLVGFCVMGGIFSEGIDLKGEKLIGTLIVGTGLPQMNHERNILKGFFDRSGSRGFDYAYRYPGMNKVEQAAGRVIRTQEDKGVVVLLDERFLQRDYQQMFPREWENYQVCSLDTIEEKLTKFWKE